MANYHVIKDGTTKSWEIKKEGASHRSGVAPTQREAEKIAKAFSHNSGGGEVRIHGLDGKIRDSDTVSPAKDPHPPLDRKH